MTYATNNITVAGALQSLGHTLDHIEVNGRLGTFYFKGDVAKVAKEIELDLISTRPMRTHFEIRRLSALIRSMMEE